MVERITGIPKDQFLKAAELFTSVRKNGDMKKAATIIYAVGWTQHTFGSQIIRTAAILQLLMGTLAGPAAGQRPARTFEHPGRDRHGRHFRQPAGLSQGAGPADTDFATYAKRITPTAAKPTEWDSFNYWGTRPSSPSRS